MLTKPALLDDQFIDMKFITQLTGLSDKWFYKLIQDGLFPKPCGRVVALSYLRIQEIIPPAKLHIKSSLPKSKLTLIIHKLISPKSIP